MPPRLPRRDLRAIPIAALCTLGVLAGCGGDEREAANAPAQTATPARTLTFPDPRKARNCVRFLRFAYRQADRPTKRVRPPGARPRLLDEVFWFGPRLGKRRATVVVEDMVVDPGDTERDNKPFATYHISYQVRADGCQNDFLPGYEPRPPNWNRGREVQVGNYPRESHTARLQLRDIPTERLRGPGLRTADGRVAHVVLVDEWSAMVVIDGLLVVFERPDDLPVAAAVRRLRAIAGRPG